MSVVSLFHGSNCGIAFIDKPVFGLHLQCYPEASLRPQDIYLFEKFVGELR